MGGLTQDFPSQGVEEWVKSLALTCLVSLLWMSVASQSEGEGCAAACHHTELPTWGGHLPVCVHRHDHHWQEVSTAEEGGREGRWPRLTLTCTCIAYLLGATWALWSEIVHVGFLHLMGTRLEHRRAQTITNSVTSLGQRKHWQREGNQKRLWGR